MAKTKYYYNHETCQYERVKLRWPAIVGYLVSLSLTVVLLSVGILILHSRLFTTPTARALRAENAALVKHQAGMQQDLTELASVLAGLTSQEVQLHHKLFEEAQAPVASDNLLAQDDLLVASRTQFRRVLKEVNAASGELLLKAAIRNQHFSSTIDITKADLTRMMALPAIVPVQLSEASKLYSGFGNRINPFHKGVYFHPGIDIAAPRGTTVMAAGNGRVAAIGRISIEAGYGNYIDIDHGYGIITRYAHLETISVNQGQRVSKGMTIGTVGSSGGSIAPHLHYEVIRDDQAVNPVDYFLQGLSSGQHQELQVLGKQKNQSLD